MIKGEEVVQRKENEVAASKEEKRELYYNNTPPEKVSLSTLFSLSLSLHPTDLHSPPNLSQPKTRTAAAAPGRTNRHKSHTSC